MNADPDTMTSHEPRKLLARLPLRKHAGEGTLYDHSDGRRPLVAVSGDLSVSVLASLDLLGYAGLYLVRLDVLRRLFQQWPKGEQVNVTANGSLELRSTRFHATLRPPTLAKVREPGCRKHWRMVRL